MRLIASPSTPGLPYNGAELGDDREKAVKKVVRRAKEAMEAVKNEKRNQAKLAAATKERMQQSVSGSPLTTQPERPKSSVYAENMKPFCGIGELVQVCSRTDAGHNRPAGWGML